LGESKDAERSKCCEGEHGIKKNAELVTYLHGRLRSWKFQKFKLFDFVPGGDERSHLKA
jgi:hypothetical protein